MQGIDSEQPLESPPVSVQMPQSPINKFDGSLNGDDDSFPQSPMYEEKVQPNSSKVKDVCHYLEFKIREQSLVLPVLMTFSVQTGEK